VRGIGNKGLAVVTTLKSMYWYWRREGNPEKKEAERQRKT
jgi:hypothetical protein